jgi:hypothetical protein
VRFCGEVEMSSFEVERFFAEHVLPPEGFIYRDIKREIDLARSGNQGGGLLATVGLLCYTEFMGNVMQQGDGSYTKQFKAFFRRMGDPYAALVDSKEIDVYRVFRSGLVHSYLGGECEIQMLNGGGHPAGIIVRSDGGYLFVVEKYFGDFIDACQDLYRELLSAPDVYLPFA